MSEEVLDSKKAKSKIPVYDILVEKKTIFEIIRIEDIPAKFENKPHRHDFYEIIWFTSDDNEILIDFNPFKTKRNSIFLITPGRVNQYDISNRTGKLIVFSKDFISERADLMHSLFMNFFNKPFIELSENEVAKFKLLIQILTDEFNESKDSGFAILESYLISFLLNIKKIQQETFSIDGINQERIMILYKLIEENFAREHRATFYAQNLNLTSHQINRILQVHLGKTVTGLIHDRLILETKRQIILSNKSMKEIAYALGFDDPAYFSRFVKKQTGSSPEVLKSQMFKKYKLKFS